MFEPHPSTEVRDAAHTPGRSLPDRFLDLARHLEDQVRQRQFTAWALATSGWAASCFFADERLPPLEGNCEWPGTLHPRFDLASLTKALFGNRLLRSLVSDPEEQGRLPLPELLADPVTESAALLRDTGSRLSLLDLMNHRGGLPAWRWFGRANAPLGAEAELTRTMVPLLGHEAGEELYSDLSYYLLSRIIHELGARSAESWNWLKALQDLNTGAGTHFVHASLDGGEARKAIPSFPYISLQLAEFPENSMAQHDFGIPHDTNANILAGIGAMSSHAGLFGSVLDVLAAIPDLARSQRHWDAHPRAGSRFSAGLDTPTSEDSLSAPQTWPLPKGTRVCGHLGFTGTAFWFQMAGESLTNSHVFLTNRTASRLVMGPVHVPRILILSALSGPDAPVTEESCRCFVLEEGCQAKEISKNDAEELMVFHSRTSARLWNRSDLRIAPNIAALRRHVAERCWKLG